MLVLSRRIDDTILIGDQIRIVICRISGTVVRVGVEAPRELNVVRGEIANRDAESTESETVAPEQEVKS